MFGHSPMDKFCIKEVEGISGMYVVFVTIEMYDNILIKKIFYLCDTFSDSPREKEVACKTCYNIDILYNM